MNKNLLKFNTYSDALDALCKALDDRKVDLNVKNIIITPENYTLLCEKRLLKNNNGAFDIDVISPGRLYFKLDGGFCLPQEGAVLILKEILSQSELKCFNRSKKHKGFCKRLYSTICDLILSGIDPDGLDVSNVSSALKIKLNDIKYIYKEFLIRTLDMRVDRHGKLEAIKEALSLDAKIFFNANVYIVNFDYITKIEEEIFDLIAKNSLSFNHYFVDKVVPAAPPAEIYQSPDTAKSIKAAAKRILDSAKNGTRFSDMCLVCAPQSLPAAKRIFNEYGIPLYTEIREKLSDKPLSRYLLSLLKLKYPSREEYTLLAKNPCAGIESDPSEIFENYTARFLIEYVAFNFEFTLLDPEKQDLSELLLAESVRRKLNKLVTDFWSRLEKCAGVVEFCDVIEKTIENHSQDQKAQEKIKEILFLMKTTFKEEAQTIKKPLGANRLSFFIDALSESIESALLSSLPATSECVIASDAASFRGGRFKYTCILDFNEGIIPPAESAGGILNTVDTKALKAAGIESGQSIEESNELNRIEILRLMHSSEKLFISYLKTEDLRPSPLIYSLNPNNFINSYEKEQAFLTESYDGLTDNTFQEFLSFYASCPPASLEYLLLSAKEPTALTSALYEILSKKADKYLNDNREAHPHIDGEEKINNKSVSASRLQTYFECPYKHFVKYALKVKPKPDGITTALDSGAVIHKMAERFVKCGLDESKLDKILNETPFGYKYDLPQNTKYKEKLKKEIKKLCLIFSNNIKSGSFKAMGAEIKIDSLDVPVQINGLTLKGSIDYADSFNGYVRIIDYKSGIEKFEAKTLHYGIRLQLPLYMGALIKNGYSPAAMFYFRFKSKWEDDGYKFSGVYNNDVDIVGAMDKNLKDDQEESKFLTAKIKTNSDGEKKVFGTGNKEESQLREYCDYAQDVSALALKQLDKGNIAPSPYYLDSRHHACKYCAYKPACAFCGDFRRLI